MLTKKDLLEAIEDMPENMPIMIYHGAYYVPIEFIKVRKLWDCGKQVETICIEPKRLDAKLKCTVEILKDGKSN